MIHWLLVLGVLSAIAGFSLAFLSQRYWFARAWKLAGRIGEPSLRRAVRGGLVAALALIALFALAVITRSTHGIVSRGSRGAPIIGMWLGSSIVSYLFIKIVAAAEVVWKRFRAPESETAAEPAAPPAPAVASAASEQVDHSRRYFFQAAGVIAGAVPFVSAAYGFAAERFRFNVREVELPVANLPPALDGLRITQLSDIHIGSYMPTGQVRRAVGMANELKGDLTVVTGDFVTGRWDPLEDCIAELSRLRAPLGVWGCNGNHEIYAGVEERAAELFQQFGMKLLRQENAELRWQGSAFNLIGVDYQRQRDPDGNRAPMLPGLEPLVRRDVTNILLSHNPNSFRRAAELGIELSLAGHTHGGQVRVEILDANLSVATFFTRYIDGIYRKDGKQIFVSRGIGTIGAPIRLECAPEVALIKLCRA